MKELHIDIETFSDVNLLECGVYRYAASPAFDIQLFSYSINDGPTIKLDLALGDELPRRVIRMLRNPKVIKVAHNASFERVCIGYFLDGAPLDPTSWRCSMVWGSCLGLPQSLDQMGAALGTEVQKDRAGKDLIRFFSMPQKDGSVNRPEDFPEKWAAYSSYNVRDVDTEKSITDQLKEIYELPEREWAFYENDQRINDRGVPIDREMVVRAAKMKDKLKDRASRKIKKLTGVEAVTQVGRLKSWAAEQGYIITSLDKQHCEDYLNDQDLDMDFPEVYKMIELYTQAGGAAVAKYDKILSQIMPDGTIKGQLRFCGAGATGRWSGKGVQLQNMARVYLPLDQLTNAREAVKNGKITRLKKYGNPVDVLGQLVRTSITPAKPGQEFAVSDYSAIEARVVAWFAGEDWALDAFRNGEDIYVATASKMYHVTGDEAQALRQKGKQATLALGYNGGPSALVAMGALRAGIPEEELPDLVKSWRRANPKIVALWRNVDATAKRVIKSGKETRPKCFGGRLTFRYNRKHKVLQIQLPGGRCLNYYDCTLKGDRIQYLKGVKGDGTRYHADTYGGKLVENIVQATSRDLLAEALYRIEAAGVATVFHVHDESINLVPQGYDIEEMNRLMTSPAPAWADGLPLNSEGAVIKFYRKV